jgi:hypothetical protein
MLPRRLFHRYRSNPPPLVVRPEMGLANRMRCVISSQAIAKQNRLRLLMLWEPTNGFSDDDWDDLFTDRIERITEEQYQEHIATGPLRLSDWFDYVTGHGLQPKGDFEPATALKNIRSRGMVIDHGFNSVISVLRSANVPGMRPCRRMERKMTRSIGIHPEILNTVNRYSREHLSGREVIGLHIRRGDAVLGNNRAKYLNSSDEAFSKLIKENLERNPGLFFYLATDCKQTEEKFMRQFPEKIICYPKSFVPSLPFMPKGGQIDALVEILLLSRTSRIIGTNWSSFSRMAAGIGGIKLQIAE